MKQSPAVRVVLVSSWSDINDVLCNRRLHLLPVVIPSDAEDDSV